MACTRLRVVLIACAATATVACAPPRKESKVAREIKIVQAENAPDRLFDKARAFHAIGDLTRAEQYYAAAMQQGYSEDEILPLLLRVCVDSSRYQVAIDYAEPILRKRPKDHRLRLVIASLYSAIGHPNKARDHYETAVSDAPNDPTARYALAVLLRDEFHDRVAADQQFREYLRIMPDGPHAEEARDSLLKEVKPAAGPTSNAPTPIPSVGKAAPNAAPGPLPVAPAVPKSEKPIKIP
jgi:tetratricopeptide (TPR) repeat protein